MMATYVAESAIEAAVEDRSPVPDRVREECDQFVADGWQLARRFVEHVHGDAKPSTTPNLLQLRRALLEYKADTQKLLAVITS